jgi:hypothetical protein
MLSFATPWWFLALLVLPLVWWVHRFHESGQPFPVAALFLWSGDQQTGQSASLAPRAHPLWWLRGLLVCLLVLALCGPRWDTGAPRSLTVWVDDSPSMYSEDEQGQSRMQRALAKLQAHLEAAPYASITLRSLGTPGRVLLLDTSDGAAISAAMVRQLSAWTEVPGGEPSPPLAVEMHSGSEHWLVSDGASDLAAWAEGAPLSKWLGAGAATENVGVSSLVVSAASGVAGGPQVLVSVRNGGTQAAQRTLHVRAGAALLETLQLSLAPAEEVQRVLGLPVDLLAGAAPLRVVLSPGDALSLDDELEIAAAELRAPAVQVSPACGSYIRAAVAANPMLAPGGVGRQMADLVIACEPDPAPEEGPAILVRAGQSSGQSSVQSSGQASGQVAGQDPGAPGGEAYWHAASGSLRKLTLAPGALRPASASQPAVAGQSLLSIGGETVISYAVERDSIDVRLDMSAPQLVQSPEYPLLVAGLIDLALGLEAGAGVIAASRNPAPAAIAPRSLVVGKSRAMEAGRPSGRELSSYLIVAALGLLCLDGLLLLFRHARLARQLRAWRPGHAS